MKLNEQLRFIAGVFVLIAVILGATVHPYWNYFAAFVAVNLIQSAFTGWCPMMALLRKLGVQESQDGKNVIPLRSHIAQMLNREEESHWWGLSVHQDQFDG